MGWPNALDNTRQRSTFLTLIKLHSTKQYTLDFTLQGVAKRSRHFTIHECQALYSEKSRVFDRGFMRIRKRNGVFWRDWFFVVYVVWDSMGSTQFIKAFLAGLAIVSHANNADSLVYFITLSNGRVILMID